MPTARYEEDEMAADPWFSVSEGDVFPEEFLPFLVPAGPLRDTFLDAHGDLLGVRFWREMQERQQAGDLPDFFPYPAARRLRPD
jgi:isocitrate dehydrogenase kinase/phosphatase